MMQSECCCIIFRSYKWEISNTRPIPSCSEYILHKLLCLTAGFDVLVLEVLEVFGSMSIEFHILVP